ncbi:vWA domain-containing protein [Dongia deserti]|uniref:VWA domain-containing protein n=1 Tax=Dongia deserti TaxID=2268030 RepID=UPI000E648188|nr:VWA domain-containing protein [Dongia deserti]
MSNDRDKLPGMPAKGAEVDAFLKKLAATPAVRPGPGRRGRLMFALDATASRQPTWDQACHIQAEMFRETAALGGLDIQVVYYRGFAGFGASPWFSEAADLLKHMSGIACLGGKTQIGRVLKSAIAETKRQKINALVFVGDCMEEDVDALCHQAGELGLLGVPTFIFHEGRDPKAAQAFRQIAHLTRGAYCAFDANSAQQLRELLSAVAVYAAGGRAALEDYSRRAGGATLLLARQVAKS